MDETPVSPEAPVDINSPLRFALLSFSTADLLAGSLRQELAANGCPSEIFVAPYNQVVQQAIDRSSNLYRFKPTIVFLFFVGQDLFQDLWEEPLKPSERQKELRVSEQLQQLTDLVDALNSTTEKPRIIISNITPPSIHSLGPLQHNSQYSVGSVSNAYNQGLYALRDQYSSISIFDYESLVLEHGMATLYDERYWYLARQRLSARGLKIVARAMDAHIQACLGRTKKCLVVDLDDALWGGVVGSVGVEGIQLDLDGPGRCYRDFQQEIANLRSQGVMLAINSKNNEADALAVFNEHPHMLLKLSDFSSIRINWRDKASNMIEISQELRIGLDSMVFVDSSPAETALIEMKLPQVKTILLPPDASLYRRTLLQYGGFGRLNLTGEDMVRSKYYEQENLRQTLKSSFADINDFLLSLNMVAEIRLADRMSLPRVAQLTQKTNQFNLTTRRYSQAQIEEMSADPNWRIYCLSLQDRFGDNGLTGLALINVSGKEWRLDVFLLSCRIMGRGAETAFLSFIADQARFLGVESLVAEFIPSAKNMPASGFLNSSGFSQEGDSSFWKFDLVRKHVECPPYIKIAGGSEK